MEKNKIIIIIGAILVVAVLIFFVLGFLRKGPQPAGGNPSQPGAPGQASVSTQNN